VLPTIFLSFFFHGVIPFFLFVSIFHFHYLKEEIKGNDDEKQKPRKIVGNTRMDAALDAIKQLGFEEKLVRKMIQELLDVYDGIQG
jgi:Holliday junction resolvasome RuvABC DNA-binding subunit